MKKGFRKTLVTLLVWTLIFSMFGIGTLFSTANEQTSRKIVVFKPGVIDENIKDTLINRSHGVKIKHLSSVNAMATYLTANAEKELRNSPDVLRIDEDIQVKTLVKLPSFISSQKLPWGVDKIDAEKVWSTTTADPIKVGIIDTGIDLLHPDLISNIKGGYNTISPRKSATDGNGHGTHVAGIIAALNNNIGVVGVGPKVDLYAIKALDNSGSGYISDIIEGIDWAISKKIQVINMSFGSNTNVQSLHDAIIRANQAGIVQIAAAGNNYGGPVNYPAAYPEVIAVSATDSNNNIASFSCAGPEVCLAAPGLNIYSTYKSMSYKTLSGTSMASPHVVGVAALVLSTPVKNDIDGNGKWSPSEIRQRLESTSTDLGDPGKDKVFGTGLVNAYKAVVQ